MIQWVKDGEFMKKFGGYATNGEFSVGCTGQTIYLYDKNNKKISRYYLCLHPAISSNGKLFVVKSKNGTFAAYSL